MLTVRMLDTERPGTILQNGIFLDCPEDVNINNTGQVLRYAVVLGGAHDWAVYCGRPAWTPADIAKYGDKISANNALRLVVVDDDEVRKRYRP